MANVVAHLKKLNLLLEAPKRPVGNYVGAKRCGNMLFASGRVSELRGVIGRDVDLAAAKSAARDTVLLILAIVEQEMGSLDCLAGVLKMQGFMRCKPDFPFLPAVLDGASNLLNDIFGADGAHARTATGVAALPFGAAVQLDIIFLLED